jgi:hypothetical protein
MAKSSRSKSKRKFMAIKRAAVFKPVDDARLQRISQKLQAGTSQVANDALMLSEEATSLAGPPRMRNRKKLAPFSAYGLCSKESKF